MDNKENFSFIFIMKQRDAGPASQKVKPFFVPMTTPRPSDTSRAKPYSVYLQQTTFFVCVFILVRICSFVKRKMLEILYFWGIKVRRN